MDVHKCYLVVTFLLSLQCTDAGGSCQENIYLEVGKQGLVPCYFENFDIIGWINGDGDVTNTSPFIYLERSQIYGRGYRSGDYDMHPNGSLIINEVRLTNEFNYTVLFVPHPSGANEYFEVPVKVYVPPDPGYPVVNGRTNQVIIHGKTRGFINCSMTGIRPRVDLEWVASPDEISLNSSHRVTDNSDGTYNTYLNSSYKVVNSPTGRVSSKCRVAGDLAALFPLETTVYSLLEQRFPVLNGLANQQHVVLDVNREGELTCSMDKVLQDVSLELVTIFPDSSDKILLDNKNSITVNGDDTVNITLTSRFQVLSDSTQHFTLKCRVSGQAADKYPEATTVELLVTGTTSMLPVPVIDGCYSQPESCTLMMTTEETITCSVKGVPHYYELNLDLYTLPDLLCLSPITDRVDTHPSGYYDIITSCHYIVDEPIMEPIVHCFLSGTDRNIQPVNSTVKAKVMWQVTDQECESLLNWQPTLAIVLLVFLVVNVIIFWLIVFWIKLGKDFARKYHWVVTNPRQIKYLEEAGSADNPNFQEMLPLQPVNNKDNIEAGCAQCSHFRGMRTKLLNLQECHLVPVATSGVPRDLEVRNAQGNEAAEC